MKRLILSLFVLSQAAACSSERAAAPPPAAPLAAAAPTVAAPPPSGAWLTKLDLEHALVGKLWEVQSGTFVESAALLKRAAKARFVLLGERHDNPDHHRLQARILEGMVDAGRRPALVLEMLEVEQQPALDRYLSTPNATATGLGQHMAWQDTSWPPFIEYQPIFEVALAAKLPIACGNMAHTAARALVKEGLSALPAERVKALRLDQALPAPLEAALTDELRASHCGHLPEKLLAPMALSQHARDAQMASVMRERGASDGAVLIAGAGHARRDRGVPYYLGLDAPDVSVLSVSLQEVQHGVVDPQAYGADVRAFDFVWFTPRGSDEDPCAAFTKPKK